MSCQRFNPNYHAILPGFKLKKSLGNGNDDIKEAIRRGASVPGGYCGLFGADGAAIASGIALSTIMKATPLSDYERRTANMMTSRALAAISVNSGMRCCKRSTYTAIESAVQYFKEVLGAELDHIPVSRLKCEHSHRNKQCSYAECRYFLRG